MNKVLVTVCAAAACAVSAVTAGAQGLGTVRDINGFGQEYLNRQKNKATQQRVSKEKRQLGSLEKAIQQQAIKHYREAGLTASLNAEEKETQKTSAKKVEKARASSVNNYYAYAGREGKIMALGEFITKSRNKKAEPAAKSSQQEKEDSVKSSFWKGLLGVAPFPGERQEDYKLRLQNKGYPSCQPFK